MDLDPLRYSQYNSFHPSFPITLPQTEPNVIHTQPLTHTQHTPNTHPQPSTNIPSIQHNQTQPTYPYYPQLPYQLNTNEIHTQKTHYPEIPQEVEEPVPQEEEDIKPDISKIDIKKPKRVKGKTSSYWNKKITDKDFKFYGCSVCNIAFQDLTDLDAHVVIHTNRVTSYDIRLQNKIKKKRIIKERKKRKKEAKVKNEMDVDIKPEDGYIGTELASDVKADCQEDKKEDKREDKIDNKEEVKENKRKGKKTQKDAVYKCFACNKMFALSYYLKIHVRSHTDEKPYICNYCGLSFITASKLGRHNKRIHLSIRHQCRICYKFYNRFDALTKHFDQKHEDQKLEGEPYDYNAILPYLTDLDDQLKVEDDKKLKTEDVWGESHPRGEGSGGAVKIEVDQIEKVETKDSMPKIEEIEVKCEMDSEYVSDLAGSFEPDHTGSFEPDHAGSFEPDHAGSFEPDHAGSFEPDSDDGGHPQEVARDAAEVKEEKSVSEDDEEYFPPDGWARSPPSPSPAPLPPSPKRKGGAGVCDLCNRSFSSRSYLKVHMRTHTGEKPYSCYICGRGFITANKMHRHVLTHDETWVGENCIKPEAADIKTEAEENGVDSSKLTKSEKVEKAKSKILKKLNNKIDPKVKSGRSWQHRCEYCYKKFLHFETLQVHKKSHDGEELVIKCHYCLEPQMDQESKELHEQSHVGQKKPYLCTLCGRNYKNSAALIYHRRNHKADAEKPFICDVCSKRFDSHAKLARHIPTHSTEKFVYRYECPVCANMFHTRWHVQQHLRSHQKEGLIMEENRNAVLAMVLQNARKIPLGLPGAAPPAEPPPSASHIERSRICNICGQIFQHFFYLEEHLKTHGNKIAVTDLEDEEEKKYTCQVCSKSFKLHYYLKLHSFTHTKEKPFICQQCGKGFITKGKLKRHLETHQGLKKYQCHICCKFFTRPSYMRIHVRTIHGTQDYNFRDYGIGIPVGLGVAGGLGQIGNSI